MVKLTRTDKAGVLSLGYVSETAARLGMMMILSRSLSLADYGTYWQVWYAYFLLLPFFMSGFRSALFYFWPRVGHEGRKELILQGLFLYAAGGLVAFALLFFGAPLVARYCDNRALETPLRVFSAFPLLALPTLAAEAVLISANKPLLTAVMGFANRVAPYVISVVALTVIGTTLTVALGAAVAGAAVLLIVTIWIMLETVRGSPLRWRWRNVMDLLKFAVPIGASPLATQWARISGAVIVSGFYTREMLAIFRNGSVEIPLLPILTVSAVAVIAPEMSAHSTNGRIDLMMDVWRRAIKKIAFVVLPATAFLFGYARETIIVLFSSKYLASLPVFLIMLFVLPLKIPTLTTPLAMARKTRAVAVGSLIGLVLVVALGVAFVPVFGLAGPAVAAVLSRLIWDGFFAVKVHQLLGVPYRNVLPWKHLAVVGLLAVVAGMVSLVAKQLGWAPVPQLVVGGLVFGAVFVPLSLLTRVFPEQERARLWKLCLRAIGRVSKSSPHGSEPRER